MVSDKTAPNRIGYRLLYDSKGCSILDHDELTTSFIVSDQYHVEIYFGPKPRHRICMVSNSAKYYVPGTSTFLGSTEFVTETDGSAGYGPFFLEIVVSIEAETHTHGGDNRRDLLLKQAASRKDEFRHVVYLVAGLIGLRFHRQFVLAPFNENVLAWDNGESVQTYAGPVLEKLEPIALNEKGVTCRARQRKVL